ncbi:MAG: DUF58 domain-containing protein [Clostridiales bacterium]|nr:DUF58 domain-containing protein [Clostridiales bacterium]
MHNSSLFASRLGLVCLLALAVACAYWGATLMAAFVLLVLLLSLGACLWSRNVLQKTTVSIGDGQTACHAGDTLPLTLTVRSRSLFPLIWLDVTVPFGEKLIVRREGDEHPQLETGPYAKPEYGLRERFAWLLWQHEITCEETLETLRRGVVPIEKIRLQAGDGLGMAADYRDAALERPARLVVYPRLVPVDIRPFTRLITLAEAGARGQTEDITLLKSSRPYQHGDPMKRINWRYLAMTGQMEVNQYETITPGCITFLLDLFSFRYLETYTTTKNTEETRIVLREKALEEMLSVLASCIRAMSMQGLRFALIVPGYGTHENIICRPGSGETALYAALEALAEINYAGQETQLPADDIRRMRRKLGVIHLCSYTDAPTLTGNMEALSCTRLRVLACLRDEQSQRTGELECTLLEDLSAATEPAFAQEGGGA